MTPQPSPRSPRACIIGLDGVPISLLVNFCRAGVMPAMARLLERGHLHQMTVSLPEISAVSWTTFMTGKNPGEHGIFGFTDLVPRSYRIRYPNFDDVKAPAFWDVLGGRGKRTIVINQPSTYPAKPIPGALVSGFVAIDLARAVQPPEHLAPLQELGYQIDVDTARARQDAQFMWQELDRTLESGRRAFDYFWSQEWDCFELIVTGTDRLQHYLWNAVADPGHSSHGAALDYYRKVDGLIATVVSAFEEATGGIDGLFLLSDHGFTGIEQEVYLNTWLVKAGYLRFDSPTPANLVESGPGTRAFALDPNRIYLNMKGRFPRGLVAPQDKQQIKAELAAALREIRFNGKPVVRRVFDADEIYSGPFAQAGPDLVVLGEPGFDMKGSLGKPEVFGRTDLTGMHTWDDAFLWTPGRHEGPLNIADVAGMILERFE
jgi:predicted AlkP superfamily phosphohydrolase/phosphomutase